MFQQLSFEEWSAIVKREFKKAALQLPEDEELLILAHMECMAEGKSVQKFVQEAIAEQGKGG
jgi:hypothetical protein